MIKNTEEESFSSHRSICITFILRRRGNLIQRESSSIEQLFLKSIITSEMNSRDENWLGTAGREEGEERGSEKNGRLKSRVKKRRECVFPRRTCNARWFTTENASRCTLLNNVFSLLSPSHYVTALCSRQWFQFILDFSRFTSTHLSLHHKDYLLISFVFYHNC